MAYQMQYPIVKLLFQDQEFVIFRVNLGNDNIADMQFLCTSFGRAYTTYIRRNCRTSILILFGCFYGVKYKHAILVYPGMLYRRSIQNDY